MILLAGTAFLALLVVSSPVSDADSQTDNVVNLQVTITIDTNVPALLVGYDSNPLAPAPVSFDADIGSVHMIFTKSPQPNSPIDTRYRFNRWAGGPTTWGWNVTIVSNNTYTANFITQYLIQIKANIENPGPTVGSDIPGCDVQDLPPLMCWADANSSPSLIILTPQSSACRRYVFLQWSDGDLRQIRPIGPITGPATYMSMWRAEYCLTMILDSSCLGSLMPTSGWYTMGDLVNIDWIAPTGLPPGEQFRFWRWIGSGVGNYTGGAQTASVMMNDAITETAYCHHEFQITLDTSPVPLVYTVDTILVNGQRVFWWEYMSTHWLRVTETIQGGTTTRYVFVDWSDGNPNPDHPAYTVLASSSLTANFQTQYKITLGQIPAIPAGLGGLGCSNADCWYDEGESATVSVTSPWPVSAQWMSYVFLQWSGDASGTSAYFTFSSMNEPKTATANWDTWFKITVTTSHGNPTCSNADCWYRAGAQASISVNSPADVTADTQYVFTAWSGDASGTSIPLLITMDSPKNVTTNWAIQYMLTIDSTCGTTIDCGYPTGSGWYYAGDTATASVTTPFTDTSSNTWDFTAWSGDSSDTTPSTYVLMDAPKNVTASWSTRVLYRLTVVTPYGTSTCSPNADCMFSPDSMATVTLSTLSVSGGTGTRHVFSTWTGDATNNSHPLILKMDGPKTVTAVWKTQYLLTLISRCDSEDDCGSPVGAGWHDNGSSVVVSVNNTHMDISRKVWEFLNWTGGAHSDANSTVVIMDGPKTAIVTWKERTLPENAGIGIWVWLLVALGIIAVILILVMWAAKRKRSKEGKLGDQT
jgi:hypothetical protein